MADLREEKRRLVCVGIRHAADQDEFAVAISTFGKADLWIDLKPDARVAQGRSGDVAGTGAGHAGVVGADDFGLVSHDPAPSSACPPLQSDTVPRTGKLFAAVTVMSKGADAENATLRFGLALAGAMRSG